MEEPLLLAFEGTAVPPHVRARLAGGAIPGVTLFRALNVETPAQVRRLTTDIQAASGSSLPMLMAADQEGGQLQALGEGFTPFPGAMALGATDDPDLAERVAHATGIELRAVGVTVAYAPVCDVATEPNNPSLGIRSFGDDPRRVAALAAATVRGLQRAGVAATAKHFPGQGDAGQDPHHELPTLDHDRDRLSSVELVPFRAAIRAGARMVMVGHCAFPRLGGPPNEPASMSAEVVGGLLRRELGFDGVVVTDALDMGAARAVDGVARALEAGVDLLLCSADRAQQDGIAAEVERARSQGSMDGPMLSRSGARVAALRAWLARGPTPELDAAGSADHLALAREVAERSVTLVRDDAGLIPLRLPPDARVMAVMPRPTDLTPADTSSTVAPSLAPALRARHPRVEEIVTAHRPARTEIASLRERALGCDLLVVGSTAAAGEPAQAGLVAELLATGVPTVTVAMRAPHDLAAYPAARTHVCTYGILPPSIAALAGALWGSNPFRGRLPAAIPGRYPSGWRLRR